MDTELGVVELVHRFGRGDPFATEALARRALRSALRTCAAIVHSREHAADLAQDVAVDVLGSLHRLRDPEAFDAWVHRIAVRHAVRHLKRHRAAIGAEVPLVLLASGDEPAADDAPDLEARAETRAVLAGALAELPARQRVALALRYVHDLSDAEIAEALGCRTGTVHALLSRARGALRRNPQMAQLAPAAVRGGVS